MASKLLPAPLGLLLGLPIAQAADIPDYPFVFVAGKAFVNTEPNIAVCSLSLRAIDADSGKAQSVISERLKSILATLTAKRIAASDIESSHIDQQILLDDNRDKQPANIRGYDVSRRLQFTVRQLDLLPSIELSFMGSPNLENINCDFDTTDRAGLEADLLKRAINSAKDQAMKLAEPLGRHVSVAYAVTQVPFESIAGMLGFGPGTVSVTAAQSMSRKFVTADQLLVPTTISLSAAVNVLFKME